MAGILPYLRLLRAGTLFSPAGDVVAGLCITAAAAPGTAVWSPTAARAVCASVLLYAAGMVWNDVADRREDAVHRPERPLPSGDVRLGPAVLLGIALLVGALLLSPPPFRLHQGAIAVLVLGYDFALKRLPLLGAVNMGLLRAMNLATAAAADWSHAPAALIAAAGCYGVYVVAVTVLGIYEDQSSVKPRAVVAVQTAPLLAVLAGLLAVQGSWWPAPLLAAGPVLWFARRNRRIANWDRAAIRRSMLFLLLGTMLYTALLCAATGRWIEAAAVAAGIPLARTVTGALQQRALT